MLIYAALTERHVVDEFSCGKEPLDEWLRAHAWRAQKAGTARTTVCTEVDDEHVVAYYSIAPTQVVRQDVPRKVAGGVSIVPGYLLARLALDSNLHGQGFGAELLVKALVDICRGAEMVGGRVIVVDPIDETADAFYRHYGFKPGPVAGRLYMLVKDTRATLDVDR